jgi:hypothetical protein
MCPSEIPCGMLHTFIERVYCINRAQKATFHSRGMLRPTAQINHPRQKWRARRIAMRPALSILTGTRSDVSVLSLDVLLPTLNWIIWAGLIAISPAQPYPSRRINQRTQSRASMCGISASCTRWHADRYKQHVGKPVGLHAMTAKSECGMPCKKYG